MANENTVSGFMITCNSCASRLKVNKPSLIGQMLACPKCGTMLKVVAPSKRPPSPSPDETPRPPKEFETGVNDSIQPTTLKTMLTTGDFDEIEQLLLSNPQLNDPAAHPDQRKFKAAPSQQSKSPGPNTNPIIRTKPQSTAPPHATIPESENVPSHVSSNSGSTASSNPLLPNDQWISHAVKKRQRMMALLAAAISLILVLLTIVIFLLNGLGSSGVAKTETPDEAKASADTELVEVANNAVPSDSAPNETTTDPNPNSNPPADSSLLHDDNQAPSDAASRSKNNPSEPTDVLDSDEGVIESPTLNDPTSTEDGDDAPPILTDEPPPIMTDDSQSDPSTSVASNNEKTNTTDQLPAFPPVTDPLNSSANLNRSSPGLSNLDRLSQMVEGEQLSVSKFKDLASSARDDQRVGLPKYFVKKNEPEPVDTAAQLGILCGQMKYEPVPLSVVLRDLMMITGVPMTIDVASVIARHGTANPKVETDVKGVDYSQAIDNLLQSAELVKLQPLPSGGLVISAANREEFSSVEHQLPKFAITGDEDKKATHDELSAIMQGMIAPDSWKLEQNPARLSFGDSKVTVINLPVVQFQVSQLLNKVSELVERATPTEPDKESPPKHLATRHQKIHSKLEQPSGLEHRFSGPLVDMLDTLSSKTGVIVLADWEALRSLGLGPLTSIPGNLTGDTLRNALIELTQTLEITYLVIDEQTILLTSFDAAYERTDLEVYSFKKLLKGKVTEEQALSILNQTLAAELKNPLIRSYYSKRLQGLFVVAPQMLHRKIEVILRGLESM